MPADTIADRVRVVRGMPALPDGPVVKANASTRKLVEQPGGDQLLDERSGVAIRRFTPEEGDSMGTARDLAALRLRPAADERQACRQDVQVTSHAETSSTECAPRRRRNCAECSTPNRGSSALMQRKKRSLDARWKRDAENTG